MPAFTEQRAWFSAVRRRVEETEGMDKKTRRILEAAALAAVVVPGLPKGIDVTRHTVLSRRIPQTVKFVVLSDLHNENYGLNMEKVVLKVVQEEPDFILMPGDMAHEHNQQDFTLVLFEKLREQGIPMYYSTGNHEENRPDLEDLLERFRRAGVHVLADRAEVFTKGSTSLEIAGVPCRRHMRNYDADQISSLFHTDHYRILLSHRPSYVELYEKVDCQMIVAGHAHGGQWRLPGTDIGLAAPDQGILPKYTGGLHVLDHQLLVISRGLARQYHGIPRLYNNPEIVTVTLAPKP
jgi:predicted MPP superfamily phosphohydrolase